MNTKEMAQKLVEIIKNRKDADVMFYNNTKNTMINLIGNHIADLKEILGYMPREKEFLDVVAELMDMALNTGIFEPVDGLVFRQVLGLVDKFVLDRYLGADWYTKCMAWAENILSVRAAAPASPAVPS